MKLSNAQTFFLLLATLVVVSNAHVIQSYDCELSQNENEALEAEAANAQMGNNGLVIKEVTVTSITHNRDDENGLEAVGGNCGLEDSEFSEIEKVSAFLNTLENTLDSLDEYDYDFEDEPMKVKRSLNEFSEAAGKELAGSLNECEKNVLQKVGYGVNTAVNPAFPPGYDQLGIGYGGYPFNPGFGGYNPYLEFGNGPGLNLINGYGPPGFVYGDSDDYDCENY